MAALRVNIIVVPVVRMLCTSAVHFAQIAATEFVLAQVFANMRAAA
jgi:hypothetical protein